MGGGSSKTTKKNENSTAVSNAVTDVVVVHNDASNTVLQDTVVTPRRPEALTSSNIVESAPMQLSLSYTPCSKLEKEQYQYYCPICMMWFQDILSTVCCANYICQQCFTEYIERYGYSIIDGSIQLNVVANIQSRKKDIFCPHCQSEQHFSVSNVDSQKAVRSYVTTPYTKFLQERESFGPSPLKAGESFDDLKRKIRPYAANAESQFSPQKWLDALFEQVVDKIAKSSPVDTLKTCA